MAIIEYTYIRFRGVHLDIFESLKKGHVADSKAGSGACNGAPDT